MATYVISDIHGEYDMLMDLLEKISLQDSDTLYVLGVNRKLSNQELDN